MGKVTKAKQQHQQPKKETPQSSQSLVNEQESQEQEDFFDGEISDRDDELLEKIDEEIQKSSDGLKLTWAAIHSLKVKQKELNEDMDNQMREIQSKFQQIKRPLIANLAKVASGIPLDKQAYIQHPLTQAICVNKNKPKGIPGFWKDVLTTVPFCLGEEDNQILRHCRRLQCGKDRKIEDEIVFETIKIEFEFSENDMIENKALVIQLQRNGEQLSTRQLSIIKFKTTIPQQSSFHEIFNSQPDLYRVYSTCQDLQRAYNNSIFYYFYEAKKQEQIDNQQVQQQNVKEQNAQNSSQESGKNSSQQNEKPSKKNTIKDTRHPVEKPECKNQ